MNEKAKNLPKRGKGGRNPKNDPANYRYSVNFTAVEHARFLTMFEQSGLQSKARFIAARVFGDEFRVVKIDRSAMEYVTKLTSFYDNSVRWDELQSGCKGIAYQFFRKESTCFAL